MVSKRMKTTPAMACLKTLLSIFSIIFLAIGFSLIGFGAYAKMKLQAYLNVSTINFTNAPFAMIGIGAFIVVVGIMGCCATVKGNTCLLRTYGVLLAVVFICELGGAIVAIIFRGKVDGAFHDGMTNAITNYATDAKYKDSVDNIQTTVHCCGVENYTDFASLSSAYPQNTVPLSCCSDQDWCKSHLYQGEANKVNLSSADNPTEYIYQAGCHAKVFSIVNNNLGIIIGVMFGVAFFQIIGIILACCLASTINANKYELV